ncbi:MAG: cyclic nucleotide-binding domain-containing protein [Aestuariivirga sp.]
MSVGASAEILRALPIFADCETVPLQIIAFTADRQEFSAGEEIITQGKKARAAFLVLSGQIRLLAAAQEIGLADPGTLLGEIAMIGAGAYSISAVALDTVSTARISRELFLKVAREYPQFGATVVRNLGDKLDASVRQLDSVRVLLDRSRKFSDL